MPFIAGRNLPDKEFRYLRTVIVTAAVYWGFDQELRLRLAPSINLPAPGRHHPVRPTFVFAECYVFNKRVAAAWFLRLSSAQEAEFHHQQQRTLSPGSYGTICPSSFSRVLSSALVLLDLTTCVGFGYDSCVTEAWELSWKHGINHFAVQVQQLSDLSA